MTVLFCFLLTLTAAEDGNFSQSAFGGDMLPNSPVAEYTALELNRWAIPIGTQALGIDYLGYWWEDNVVAYISNQEDNVYWMNGMTGAVVGSPWPTDVSNTSPFGLARVFVPEEEPQIHVNDFNYDAIFFRDEYTAWDEYNALADNMGRGMHYFEDEDRIFEIYTVTTPGDYSWYVAMYTPGTSTGNTYELDCDPGADWSASGLTLFPMFGGGTGIAVTMYESKWIRFFDYPGSPGEVYYGYCVLPYEVEMESSYGLAYAPDLDCFFHSWRDAADNHFISRLEVQEVALDQSTWGGIKSRF
ncbi:MAG: hypothetical protein R6U39_04100 [Candidatus Aegiribacteria sp.]